MQIFIRFYPFIIACSVLGLNKGFLNFLFGGGAMSIDTVACLKHFTLDCELGCGFFLFLGFKQVSKFLCILLMSHFVIKLLQSDWRLTRGSLVRFLCEFRGKSVKLYWMLRVFGKCSYVWSIDKFDEMKELSDGICTEYDGKTKDDCDGEEFDAQSAKDDEKNHTQEEEEEEEEEEDELEEQEGVSELKKMVGDERQRARAAVAELEKERAASTTAAEEAMAMILKLQNEKSSVEMELSQYRRLAEEKQIHDQRVIQSLQWLVWRHESERSLLEDQLESCRQKLKRISSGKDESEEAEWEGESCFNGSFMDALENVLYSSRDANLSSERV